MRNLSYQGKFQWNLGQGKGNLVWVSRNLEFIWYCHIEICACQFTFLHSSSLINDRMQKWEFCSWKWSVVLVNLSSNTLQAGMVFLKLLTTNNNLLRYFQWVTWVQCWGWNFCCLVLIRLTYKMPHCLL